MSDIILGRKSDNLIESGYVLASYIPVQTSTVVHGFRSKKTNRKLKINKVFGLGLDISDEFSPTKTISSRYSTNTISSNYYSVIEIKKPT
jgi:hypothetical protein